MSAPSPVVYAVRVDFREGDHAFWGWRRSPSRACRLRHRLTNSCRGMGIATLSIVAMSEADWKWHLKLDHCISPLCPSIRPDDQQPSWGCAQSTDDPTGLAARFLEVTTW